MKNDELLEHKDTIFLQLQHAAFDIHRMKQVIINLRHLMQQNALDLHIDVSNNFMPIIHNNSYIAKMIAYSLYYSKLNSEIIELSMFCNKKDWEIDKNAFDTFISNILKQIHHYSLEEIQEINKNIIQQAQVNNTQDGLGDIEHFIAAKNIFNILRKYQPAWYDILGYDLSRSREKIIKKISDECELEDIYKKYHLSLTKILHAKNHSRIEQDMYIGLFINEVCQDYNIDIRHAQAKLHPNLIAIAIGSLKQYKRTCQAQAIKNCMNVVNIAHMDLLNRLYNSLLNIDTVDLSISFKKSIEQWLQYDCSIIQSIENRKQRIIIIKGLNAIIEKLQKILGNQQIAIPYIINHATTAVVKINDIKFADLGELIWWVCYHKAHLEHTINTNYCLYNKILNEYNHYIQSLHSELRLIHEIYMNKKKRKVHANRISKVLKEYGFFHFSLNEKKIFDKIVNIINDPTAQKMFAPYLNELLTVEMMLDDRMIYKWNTSPEEIMQHDNFGLFLHYIASLTQEDFSSIHFNRKLREIFKKTEENWNNFKKRGKYHDKDAILV